MENLMISVHETFQETVQGEGFWTGTPVDFIRLAGCPVGCHYCDTGYAGGGGDLPRVKRSFEELIKELRSPRVVISGGEPFIHNQLPDLINQIEATGRQVSLETSGSFWQEISPQVWVTLSPKEHLNPQYPVVPQIWARANEIKLVIETGLELEYYAKYLPQNLPPRNPIPVFLQPEWSGGDRSLQLVLELLKRFPQYRLSVQLHKYLGVK